MVVTPMPTRSAGNLRQYQHKAAESAAARAFRPKLANGPGRPIAPVTPRISGKRSVEKHELKATADLRPKPARESASFRPAQAVDAAHLVVVQGEPEDVEVALDAVTPGGLRDTAVADIEGVAHRSVGLPSAQRPRPQAEEGAAAGRNPGSLLALSCPPVCPAKKATSNGTMRPSRSSTSARISSASGPA